MPNDKDREAARRIGDILGVTFYSYEIDCAKGALISSEIARIRTEAAAEAAQRERERCKVIPVSAEDVKTIRCALELLEMLDMSDDGAQARDALAALDRIAGKEEPRHE